MAVAAIPLDPWSTSLPPSSFNTPGPEPTVEPWRKVFQASSSVDVLDTPSTQETLNDWEQATPLPPSSELRGAGRQVTRQMGVVPYDMQIGARIMYGLTEKAPPTPPPTQELVNQAFVAQCPMIMFANQLSVRAPRCGSNLGDWADAKTNRRILRWKEADQGGLVFAVDSLVTGNGSVAFADFRETFSVNKYYFALSNCLHVNRYTVEESVIKIDHMAARAYTTMYDHDLSHTREAIFYKYTIRHPNGTAVAMTSLFRTDQHEVNFTRTTEDEAAGELIAVARREGHWSRSQWRECTSTPRGWSLRFPEASKFDTVATVQDLRVVAAATVTMMAYRAEDVGADGFEHAGQAELYLAVFRAVFMAMLLLLMMGGAVYVFQRRGVDKKLRRFCFRLESVMLPKRPTQVRQPVLHPTY